MASDNFRLWTRSFRSVGFSELTALFAVLFAACLASAEDDSAKLFQDAVRPLFERKCFQCHSEKADELKGNLKLESLESILKGGDQGPAIVAGDVENSFLLRAIRYQVEDFQMPPAGKLSDADIALIEKWVKSLGSGKLQKERRARRSADE
jgi:mono/diheme cytochrome c family protein